MIFSWLFLVWASGVQIEDAVPEDTFLEVTLNSSLLSESVPPLEIVVRKQLGDSEGTSISVAQGQGEVSLPVAPGEYSVACKGEGAWCPTLSVTVGKEGKQVSLPVFPKRSFRLTLKPPAGMDVPPTILLQGWVYSQPPGEALPMKLEVDRAPSGPFEFSGPGARVDLRLAAEGWAPLYFWDVEGDGGTLDLGEHPLTAGGSVCGFLVSDESGLPEANAMVSLRPLQGALGASSQEDARRRARLIRKAQTNDRGFFQIQGVPTGHYRLDASARSGEAKRSAEARVEVQAWTESCLERWLLRTLQALRVRVEPATDPDGNPWQISLWGSEQGGVDSQTDPEGIVELGQVPRGRHRLRITDTAGERVAAFELLPESWSGGEFLIHLDIAGVEGEVLLGEDPLPAEISLQTGNGIRIPFSSDEEGHFSGWVPRPQRPFIRVTVKPREDSVQERDLLLRKVDPEEDPLQVVVRLPNGSIRGQVVNSRGMAVFRAEVRATGPDLPLATTLTDEDGLFELHALPTDSVRVQARVPGLWSKEVEVQASEGEGSYLRLMLEGSRWVEGQVLSAEGLPIVAAEVTFHASGSVASQTNASTDVQGVFRILLPAGARQAVVQVAVPATLLWSGCLDLPRLQEGGTTPALRLRLPVREGGSIFWEERFDETGPPIFATRYLLTRDGGFLNVGNLLGWTEAIAPGSFYRLIEPGRSRTYIPRLAAGFYAPLVSEQTPLQVASVACSSFAVDALDWYYLPGGEEIQLPVDMQPLQEAVVP